MSLRALDDAWGGGFYHVPLEAAVDLFKGIDKLVRIQNRAGYPLAEYLRCVLLQSETAVAVFSSGPGDERLDFRGDQDMSQLDANYAPETCAYCGGRGTLDSNQCRACGGQGSVVVAQPARKCAQCQGRGRKSAYRCSFCLGTGWAQALRPSTR